WLGGGGGGAHGAARQAVCGPLLVQLSACRVGECGKGGRGRAVPSQADGQCAEGGMGGGESGWGGGGKAGDCRWGTRGVSH
ncbi:hypothetical protein ABPG77_006282, partial [Micractinium sp. CCAP 211/92]